MEENLAHPPPPCLLFVFQLLNSSAPATFRQYNQEQMLAVQSPAGHSFLITEHNEVGDGQYVDPRGKIVVKFDHIKQQVLGQAGGAPADAQESLRAQFDAATLAYQVDHYPEGTASVFAKGGKIIVCIQSSKYNPSNFWNGRWRSVYHCQVQGGEVVVKGNIKIQVHYYEDGNVQLNTDTNKNFKVAGGADAAKNTVEAIKKLEKAFHTALEVSYNTMGDTTFKALRRALPLTRTKIDWNMIKSYRVGNQTVQQK
jgi:capping protein alpha